jgi:hypothetical protein
MATVQEMCSEVWKYLIFSPILSFVFKKPRAKIEAFLQGLSPKYSNLYYKTAAKNNTNRSAVLTLMILVAFILFASEIICLAIWDPSIPVVDNAISEHSKQVDKMILIAIFIVNVVIIESVIRQELIYTSVTNFNQMLTIIRPDISPEKYYQIKKDWALMKTKDEYKRIIMKLLSTHNILIDKQRFPEEVKLYNKIKL